MRDEVKEIRAAIELGNFARAGVLWEEWTRGAVSADKWVEAQELYRWGRNALLAERSHLLHQLNGLHAANSYLLQDRF
jgi:hypothetical protein